MSSRICKAGKVCGPKWFLGIGAAMILVSISGCGSGHPNVFTNPEADLSFYTRVGIVPFNSLTPDRFAGDKFAIEFATTLLAANLFEVVDYGVFVQDLQRAIGSRSAPDGLSVEQLKKVGEVAGVQGVFIGAVSQYELVQTGSGTFPVISVEARLVDTETGAVVWMATCTERGGPKTPIIGVGEIHTLGGLAQKISKKLVSKLE